MLLKLGIQPRAHKYYQTFDLFTQRSALVPKAPKNVYVSGFPTLLRFCPNPKHLIVNCELNVVKYAENGGICIKKMQFLYKISGKIK